MPTSAFLLCSDEKASGAVTLVLGDLEVGLEHFQQLSTAMKRLPSQPYDVILVDCDNPDIASQVFNSVKSSSINQGAITIAIVDGKAGLPTAFRLGASLVLTKPVSLEQARGTIRNALAMRRKTVPEGKASAAAAAHGNTSAGTISSTPSGKKDAATSVIPTTAASTPSLAPVEPPGVPAPPASAGTAPGTHAYETSFRPDPPRPKRNLFSTNPTDIKQLSEQLNAPKSMRAKTRSFESDDAALISHGRGNAVSSAAPAFSVSEKQGQRKTSRGFLAVVALLLAASGFYAAWTMQAGFHSMVRLQYDRLYSLVTGTAPRTQAVAPAPLPPHQAPAPVQPPAPAANAAAANPDSSASTTPDSPMPDGFAPAGAAPSQGFAGDRTAEKPAASAIPPSNSVAPAKTENQSELVEVAEELADEHVAYRVRPVYPEAVRHKGIKGEVVVFAVINKDGAVASAKMLSGNPVFASAAVAAVKQWRYESFYQDGQPAAFKTKVSLQFVPPAKR